MDSFNSNQNQTASEPSTITSQPTPPPAGTPTVGLTPGSPSMKSPKRRPHKLTIALIIICIVAIGAAVTFAILWLNSQPEESTPPTPPSETTATEQSPVEQEITDQQLVGELSQKVSTLVMNHKAGTDQYVDAGGEISIHTLSKFAAGNISDELKGAIAIDSLDGGTALTSKYSLSDLGSIARGKLNTEWFAEMDQYKANQFNDPYKSLFNADLPLQDITAVACPYEYIYDNNTGIFINNSLGCGGTFYPTEALYKVKYTQLEDDAYVYVAMGSIEPKDDNGVYALVYADVLDNNKKKTVTKLAENNMQSKYITADNYTDFTPYRFVFNKNSDGEYYFGKVEKLNSF